jgi:hypothetical protein
VGGVRDHHRQESVLERIAAEDIGERCGDHGPEAVVDERPRGVLARRPASEVASRDENLRAARFRLVQDEVESRCARRVHAPIGEEMRAEAGAHGRREKAGRDDLVRVDVVEQEQRGAR